jgi:hypothetical protein
MPRLQTEDLFPTYATLCCYSGDIDYTYKDT